MMELDATESTGQWQQVQQIFTASLGMPATARADYVQTVPASAAVRAAVSRLLAVHDECTQSDQATGQRAVMAALSTIGQRLDLKTGDTVNDFAIQRLLGEGGMGCVYLAERKIDSGAQRVALKVVARAAPDARVEAQLRRERAILADLDHPNIARLVDAGETSDGRPYFAMEYVDGQRITRYCDERQLDIPSRLKLFLSVCDAVAYAHRRLVLHRDLKPSNILVDVEGRVRLLDFGIARTLDQGVEATRDGSFFSLDCAAPEQVNGRASSMATDVYGLGCLLHELLCGRTPFDFTGVPIATAIARILDQVPPPASSALGGDAAADVWRCRGASSAAHLMRMLRGDLDAVVATALRKQPDERYASIEALGTDVRNVLQAKPIAPRASERWYRLRCFIRRHRLALSFTVVLGSVIVALLGATIVQSRRTVVALAQAEQQRDHARGVTTFLVRAFDLADPLRTRGQELRAVELLQSASRSLSDQPMQDPQLRANVSQTLSLMFFRLAMRDAALAQLEISRHAMAELKDPPTLLVAQQQQLEGELAFLEGRFKQAIAQASDGLARLAADSSVSDGDLEVRLALTRSKSLVGIGEQAKAVENYRAAIARLAGRADVPDALIETLMLPMARLMNDDGRQVEAGKILERLLAMQRTHLPDNDQAVIGTMRGLSRSLYRQQRIDAAIAQLEPALAAFIATYGEKHADVAVMMAHLGEMYGVVGRAAEGERLLRRGIAIVQELQGSQRTIAALYDELAILYRDQYHDLVGAEQASRLALAATPKQAQTSAAFSQRILAETLIAAGRYFEAEFYANQAVKTLRKSCGDDCNVLTFLQGDLAWIRFRQYDFGAAANWLQPDIPATLRAKAYRPHQLVVRRRADEIAATLRL